ncbi:MAG: septal ring lytic transglycosylase RlpA family protein [Gammaproteobacteria bacterium]|nr:septal ring lytic transglycosylase RlpA family protein [Gammaproteobacteria bacterium]
MNNSQSYKLHTRLITLFLLLIISGTVFGAETGIAAYYSDVFQGRKTASGKPYDKNALTAAHNTHSFGTRLKVTNLNNNKTVIVKVTDRGPHSRGRIIDLSRRAAKELGFIKQGLTEVKLEVIN